MNSNERETSGVYTITNKENGRVYIGSTVNFKIRWEEHRRVLRKGNHYNPHLQRSWNKYGEGAFELGVLEYLDNLDELTKAEQFWMNVYREEGRELYNVALAADSPMRGRKHTEDTRQQMCESHKGMLGKHHSEESRRKIGDANRDRKLPPISNETRRRMSKSKMGNKNALGHTMSEENRKKLSKPYPAFINDLTGEIISASINLHAMCRERGLNSSCMRDLFKRGLCTHHGWKLL